MPGVVANGGGGGVNDDDDKREENERNVMDPSPSKEASIMVKPENHEREGPEDFGVDGVSIEQLYENVCDMQSSDQSPSRQSFGSDGDESRIDSELRHLVGGSMREVEIMEEEMEEKPEATSSSRKGGGSSSNGKKLENVDEIQPAATSASTTSSGSVEKPNKASSNSKLQQQPKTLSKPRPKAKTLPSKPPPIERKNNDKALTKHNTGVSATTSVKKPQNSPSGRSTTSQNRAKNSSAEPTSDKPEMGPSLLKQAMDLLSSGENPQKALELALRATKVFEKYANEKPSLELVMCLHVTASIHCSLGQYNDAIPILKRSIEIPVLEEGQDHALGKFAGLMQLGDTYAMLGQLENSIKCYNQGLEVQRQVLGETDPRVGETCRYLAEAYVQALQFDEAERLCQMALETHRANDSPPSLEEAADRRLMGLICETNGKHEAALEHLVLASMAMVANGQEVEVASVDCSIGDTYLSLSRYDEAIFAYQKALTVFKSTKGENHPAVGLVFVRLADLFKRTGKIKESKSHCENALRLYEKPLPGVPPEDIASGFADIAAIYESMEDHEQALNLLQKALVLYNNAPGQQSTIAGIEAQMGVLYYILGNYSESYNTFKSAISKLRAIGEKKSAFFGIALNQMGLACVQRYSLSEAAELFEEAKTILEQEYGPYHPETLGVYSNLAGTYDAIGRYIYIYIYIYIYSVNSSFSVELDYPRYDFGSIFLNFRLDDAIEILEYVVGLREEKLGTANPDVYDEKRRLSELLKEAGRVRNRKSMSLEHLLDSNVGGLNNLVMRMELAFNVDVFMRMLSEDLGFRGQTSFHPFIYEVTEKRIKVSI
ncbi:protein KINESIN LIGHT CHAIN-RELATED 3-like [Senna tora]|uniref:Protein KINESIN LIGHT CHAIN-RELATED 3-like n=1 Tax=Senna tora TaxID=362788 RepID=A0A835CF29_9FABA|nr:protein KINESIN LIGHT CHAIN-RELATED 3-like [Senna tora]